MWMGIPELISPGGSYNKALVAATYGADAVYLGVPFTSLRMRQNKMKDFDILQQTIDDLHWLGKKAYLTMNIFPRNMDINIFEWVIEKIARVWADAIIFSDPGTFKLIRKYLPDIRLHLSTQANVLNHEAISFWYDLGVSRVVLARELTLKEIEQIKQKVPGMELEIFVHGAMCIAYSWRCLMGEYFSGRDGNKGECSHVCRYKFKVHLEEEKRPGKFFELGQDDDGTYMMSSKDLCTIERLWELLPLVDGLKIEWRSKSELYVGVSTRAYRHVRDVLIEGTIVDENIKKLLYQMPHRPYWEWFLFNKLKSMPDGEVWSDEIWTDPNNEWVNMSSPWPVKALEYCGVLLPETIDIEGREYCRFVPKQKLLLGDTVWLASPSGQKLVRIEWFSDNGRSVTDHVNCNTKQAWICADHPLQERDVIYRELEEGSWNADCCM